MAGLRESVGEGEAMGFVAAVYPEQVLSGGRRELTKRFIASDSEWDFTFAAQVRELHCSHGSAATGMQVREDRAILMAKGEMTAHAEVRL